VRPTIEVYQVQHLPSVQASADKMGCVEASNQVVPTAMALDPGTIVRGMLLETLSGRSPLYRVEEGMAQHDTALLVGKALPSAAFKDAPGGRVLERLDDTGTMPGCPACAVRADQVWGCAKRSGHLDTTAVTVSGDALPPEASQEAAASEEQTLPVRLTDGSSQAKRPALKPFVVATWGGARAGPLGGQPAQGPAAAPTVHPTLLADLAPCLAPPGVAPGADLAVAAAALGTAEQRAARGDTRCIPRFPAPANACGRLMAEAVAHRTWAEGGGRAHPQPTPPRPAPSSQTSEGAGRL